MKLSPGKLATALPALLLATTVSAVSFHRSGMEVGPVEENETLSSVARRAEGPVNGWGEFDQLIDHANPQLGTFKQRYWYGTQYWNGTGSPIIITNPGEQSATGFNVTYTTKRRLSGLMAEKIGAAVIVIEHRYWGESTPYKELTSENLQYLTLNNSIHDMIYFVNNFKAPFDDAEGATSPDRVPWIYTGGSYSGALAGWIASKAPGTFWAIHGSSGVVEAVRDMWTMFTPVQEAMPRNCSRDVSAAIDYMDGLFKNGSRSDVQKLKAKFMLDSLSDADFGQAIENGPWLWQSTQFYSANTALGGVGYNQFHRFCDYVEGVPPNSTAAVPGEEGVGFVKAIEGYAKWFTEFLLPGQCESYGYPEWQGEYNTGCFQNQNASNPQYSDLSYNNTVNRQWNWMLCNEPFGWWQNGAPAGRPSIVSRFVNNKYWTDQCELWFPGGAYGFAQGKTETELNAWTGGWSELDIPRLMYANGQYDPWREVTVSSSVRPGGPMQSSADANNGTQVRVLAGGTHCSDLYGPNWEANEGAKKIADDQTAQMAEWVDEFYAAKGLTR
ncbi:hypothetical protein PgNI_05425 [Pyricularia grisea]|uniref:Uncharacterized protein n=1 Tax=Pyricularia grisea TaxID=148305 RepID=A0A6P8B4L4_PYRGI|nr:hypothetical protein PgNI_05425 [Pyricularia grisea]TLD10195.1 hypothetical protein PgNI_05425 [Pyricularia grisea]